MCFEDVAREQAEDISDNWLTQFLEHDILRPIGNFMLDHNGGSGNEFAILKKGSYNISLRLKDENVATVIRFSQPGAVLFPEEKVVNEAAVMRFLTEKTSIPIPSIQHSGTKKESPLKLSPFFMMDYIEHDTQLEACHGRNFQIYILHSPQLHHISKLLQTLILRIWFINKRDSVESADDCRRKFVARQLFRKLAKEKRLTNLSLEKGLFKIWCDDLRPANVLLHENLQIAGVIEWEFTYAAPAEFSHAPPWWLLIEKPEYWSEGLEDGTRVFDDRLKTFFRAMKDHEDTAI
ncbi:kinase-like domain-containing protein [Penicillium nucicola]|uniref:kinase-like domain-containing protein n=1 Tax=Penicillium nucicola TaxID=1850975 RepID=UPI0025457FDD|nr:kinase-like domain-containing protein [Penicillium nucicola]KAJ5771292.1 kinase-like domain-containing protein [Penicillium nucicola]